MGVLPLMRRAIRLKAAFDINDLDALALAPSTFIPALFAHAKGDTFVQPHHSAHIAEAYAVSARVGVGGPLQKPLGSVRGPTLLFPLLGLQLLLAWQAVSRLVFFMAWSCKPTLWALNLRSSGATARRLCRACGAGGQDLWA